VTCNTVFTAKGPVEAVKFFMMNFCGYVSGNFDPTSYTEAAAEEADRGYKLDGAMNEQKTLSSWLDQIRNEFELDIWWDMASGLIRFSYLGQNIDTASAKHFHDYLSILSYTPDQRVDLIMNWCRPGYNYDYAQQNFKNYGFAEDAISQVEHGGVYSAYPVLYFVRDSGVAYDLALHKVTRQRDPIAFETFVMPLKAFSLLLAEVCRFTHFDGAGLLGYVGEYFQLRRVDLDLNKFTFSGIFEKVSSFYGNEMILGDETALAATWLTASDADKKYAYMCDETTGLFSNGDPGKRMNDE
jgi:hypothetical protein